MIDRGLHALEEEEDRERRCAVEQLRERNEALVTRGLASLEAYHRRRLDRVEAEIQQAHDERILRMRRAERAHVERDFTRRRTEIESRRQADILSRPIAYGLLEIHRAQ